MKEKTAFPRSLAGCPGEEILSSVSLWRLGSRNSLVFREQESPGQE